MLRFLERDQPGHAAIFFPEAGRGYCRGASRKSSVTVANNGETPRL